MTTLNLDTWFNAEKLIDEDDMSSNSAIKVPSQQSVKAYVSATAGTDSAAIHKGTANEFFSATNGALAAIADTDRLLIEDASASYAKAYVTPAVLLADSLTKATSSLTGFTAVSTATDMGGASPSANKVPTQTAVQGYSAKKGANSDITSITGLTTPLDETLGGTGLTSITQGSILYGSDTNVLSQLAKGTANQKLVMNPSAVVPMWANDIAEVSSDTTPVLGGHLMLGDFTIELEDTPTTGKASGERLALVMGESVVFGDLLYMKSDGKLWKSDANVSATMPAQYMALASFPSNAVCKVLRSGTVTNSGWSGVFSVGAMLYVSTTAGAFTSTKPSTSGDIVQVIGRALTTTTIDFNPQLTWVTIA